MRIFILSLLIALLPAISFGQDYEPLLKEGKWWNYSYDNVFSNNFDYLSVGIGEDVSIDGITYKSIYDLRYPGSYIYAMREEDKKVYSVLPWDETPQLIYDFGKNAGEIVSEEIDNNIKTIVKVISIDSVVYRDHILRRMLVAKEYWKSGKLNKTENSVWIEGVGSPFGLINPFPVSDSYLLFCSCYSDEGRDLICENEQFWEGGAPIGTHQVTINGLKYYLYPDTHDAAINYNNTWVGELNIPSEVSYNISFPLSSGKYDLAICKHNYVPYVVHIDTESQYIQNITFTKNAYYGYSPISVGCNVTTSIPYGDVVIESGAKVIIRRGSGVEIKNGFECQQGGELIIK